MSSHHRHLWQEGAAFAARAHRDHLRKDRQTPYFSHPVRVAMTVACIFGETDPAILTAALLHDTIEDTRVDYDDVHQAFGREVADIVAALSKDRRLIDLRREPMYDRQLASASWKARLVKLADVYDNYMDCDTAAKRAHQMKRIRRALAIAGNDPRLARAVFVVRALDSSSKTRPGARPRKKARRKGS